MVYTLSLFCTYFSVILYEIASNKCPVSIFLLSAKSAIVLSFITDDYKALLEDSFGVKEFDNFEYVKGKVLGKYSRLPKTVQLTETFEKEYIDDILQICRLMISASYMQEVQELIAERCIILAKDSDGTTKLQYVYV